MRARNPGSVREFRPRIATLVFVGLFLFVTWVGFVAAHWRKADLDQLHEWGLGGRRFGTIVTWFLLGWGSVHGLHVYRGACAGVWRRCDGLLRRALHDHDLPDPMFLVFPRLWTIARREGHVTAADYVKFRFKSRALALAVALTGLVATMPYIALQLVGMEVVIGALGFDTARLHRAHPAHHRVS